jgi:hypothetical protein
LFKLVAFVNGDVQTKIVDLKKNATTTSKKNSIIITVSFYFDETNDVSKINLGMNILCVDTSLKRKGIIQLQLKVSAHKNKENISFYYLSTIIYIIHKEY